MVLVERLTFACVVMGLELRFMVKSVEGSPFTPSGDAWLIILSRKSCASPESFASLRSSHEL